MNGEFMKLKMWDFQSNKEMARSLLRAYPVTVVLQVRRGGY